MTLALNLVFVIYVYNVLHQLQTVLPGSYPNEPACKAVLVQTHLTFGNWGNCERIGLGQLQQLRHTLHSRG